MARKDRKISKNHHLGRFRGVKMLVMARNAPKRSKQKVLNPCPYQIDPRGSNGARIFEIRSYYAGYVLENLGWLSCDPQVFSKWPASVDLSTRSGPVGSLQGYLARKGLFLDLPIRWTATEIPRSISPRNELFCCLSEEMNACPRSLALKNASAAARRYISVRSERTGALSSVW